MQNSPEKLLNDIGENPNLTEQQKRFKQSRIIIQFWHEFKVCGGCESIVMKSAATCALCHHYSFEEDQESIVKQAEKLAFKEKTVLTAADYED